MESENNRVCAKGEEREDKKNIANMDTSKVA